MYSVCAVWHWRVSGTQHNRKQVLSIEAQPAKNNISGTSLRLATTKTNTLLALLLYATQLKQSHMPLTTVN